MYRYYENDDDETGSGQETCGVTGCPLSQPPSRYIRNTAGG